MQTKHLIDKSTWGDGPWQHEPDWVEWSDRTTGLSCRAIRDPHQGCWCGYVGVDATHPCYGLSENALDGFRREVNYADALENSELWWFGFDCCGGLNICPGSDALFRQLTGWVTPTRLGWTYRTLGYVAFNCTLLALGLHNMGQRSPGERMEFQEATAYFQALLLVLNQMKYKGQSDWQVESTSSSTQLVSPGANEAIEAGSEAWAEMLREAVSTLKDTEAFFQTFVDQQVGHTKTEHDPPLG